MGLSTACFHGHWRLVQFLIEHGSDVNLPEADTGETPLHSSVCGDRPSGNLIVKVLLANGADPNVATIPGIETSAFMRDIRTRGETPLHRAAAFCGSDVIQLLLDAGARREVKDCNGDSPLTWASWHLRPSAILRLLCYDKFRIHAKSVGMDINLLGNPHV